ncbi:MAG: serine hydrolase, partial [Steroidobacteraceae bacterium]
MLRRLAISACCSVLGLHAAACAAANAAPQHAALKIVDDARLQQVVEEARSRFLARQPFDRFDVTVLIAHATRSAAGLSEEWLRASVGGDNLAYPASCVKLPYLVAAVHWCQEQQRAPDCLDADVRPMILVSDNVATGRVIDAITGTANLADGSEAQFSDWFERRRYPERVLESQSLLGSQRLFTKTYPTNSGEEPTGFEARAWRQHGRNAMSPDLAARLMLAIAAGRIEPQATGYMRDLLRRERFSADSGFGAGLPPGATSENKIGSAFDTLEDISYAELPGGGRLVIAGFSNGWNPEDPPPGDVHRLGDFTVELLRAARAARLLPPEPIPGIEFAARVAQVLGGDWRAPGPE